MPSADSNFVHLHVHSDYSLLDGACRIDRLMERAAALGMKALALTDHGNLFGAIDFFQTAKKHSIKPLLGCELYLTEGSRLEKGSKENAKYYHMGVLARNRTGYQNLLRLVSDAHLQGFYYKPRADLETLAAHAEGLIGFTGCLQGMVPQLLLQERGKEAREALARFVDIFGRENYFVEIMDHGLEIQGRIIKPLLKLAEEFKLRVVCTNDVHYVNSSDASPHDALLCIQTGTKLDEANRMRYDSQQFYLKTREEMARTFSEIPESLLNTERVAEMCDLSLAFGENHYPVYPLPAEITVDRPTYLRNLCVDGLRHRYGIDFEACRQAFAAGQVPPADASGGDPERARVLVERTEYELGIIDRTGFVDYFLIVWDFIHWARTRGIPVGPGRGSGAGCLVAYLLGITDLDPIRFKLLFERFLNPERVSPPDFDIDFCMRRRGEVIDYVRQKYGKECVANIITFGTLGAKMVIRDVARVHGVPYADADRLAKMIPDELNISLEDALAKSSELRAEVGSNPTAARIVEHGRVLEGMVRNVSTHAAGVIIADRPLSEFVPLTLQDGSVTTQFAMDPVQKLGLLKMDFLGLKTLTVIHDAVINLRRTADPAFDLARIPLDDARTFALLNEGRTVGVFQMESSGMQSLCRQFNLSSIDEIVALIALYRPGPMDWIPDYIRGKKDPCTIKYPHPLLEEVCRETYGVMVYQEQVMEAAKIIAGYSLGGADILRRAMGKKDPEIMAKQRSVFVEGAQRTHGIDERRAVEIFAILEKFAGYGFNKSHSAAYAILGYQTAYLKANYPVQFMAGLLSNELGNSDKVAHFIDECSAMGIRVLGPHVNQSREMFTPVLDKSAPADADAPATHSIRFGLAAIKGVGDSASSRIIEEREQNGPYLDFDDFLARVDTRAVNKRVLECLIKTGAFDFSGAPRRQLFERIDQAMAAAAARQRDLAAGQESFLDLLAAPPPARSAPALPSPGSSGSGESAAEFPLPELLQHEKELLGFYVSGHPMNSYEGLAQALASHREDELMNLPDRSEFRLCGVAGTIVKKLSKRDNRPWAAFTLATKSATLAMVMYSDAFEEFNASLENEKTILVQGTVLRSNDDVRLNVKECYQLDRAVPGLIKKITWVLRPDSPQADDFLQCLRQTIDSAYGDTRVDIGFLFGGELALAETAGGLSWRVEAGAYQQLRHHPAVAGTLIETKPIQLKETRRWGRRNSA